MARTGGYAAVILTILGALIAFFDLCFAAVQAFEWLTVLTGGRPTLCLGTSPGVYALTSLLVAALTGSPLLIFLYPLRTSVSRP